MQRVCLAAILLLGTVCLAHGADQVLLGLAPIQQQEELVAQSAESAPNRALRSLQQSFGSFADKASKHVSVSLNGAFTDITYGKKDTGKQDPVTIRTHVSLFDGNFYVFSKEQCAAEGKTCKKEKIKASYDETKTSGARDGDKDGDFTRTPLSGTYYKDQIQFTSDKDSVFADVKFGVVQAGNADYDAESADAYLGLGFTGAAPVKTILDSITDPFITIRHAKDSNVATLLIGNKTGSDCPKKQSKFYETLKDSAKLPTWTVQAASVKLAGESKEKVTVFFDLSVEGIQLPSNFFEAVKKLQNDKDLIFNEQASVPGLELTIGEETFPLKPEELSVSKDKKYLALVQQTATEYGAESVVLGRAFLKQYCLTLSLEKPDAPSIALSEPRTFNSATGMSMMAALLLPLVHLLRL